MKNRASQIATVISTMLCGSFVLLLPLSFFTDPMEHRISFSKSVHVTLRAHRGLDSRIVFFNDADGPYFGSIIGILDADGNVYPPGDEERAFGDCCGIYYRYFHWPDGTMWPNCTLWTLSVSLYFPIAMFAIIPFWRWRTSRNLCMRSSSHADQTAD